MYYERGTGLIKDFELKNKDGLRKPFRFQTVFMFTLTGKPYGAALTNLHFPDIPKWIIYLAA